MKQNVKKTKLYDSKTVSPERVEEEDNFKNLIKKHGAGTEEGEKFCSANEKWCTCFGNAWGIFQLPFYTFVFLTN